jgi:uncharacterized protein YdeI (YjbR/CyaY-like superfamily)
VHKGCPDADETIKWGMPSFEYKGPFCSMAAFKQHCVFGFWKAALLEESQDGSTAAAMNWGAHGRDPIPARITSKADLPSDAAILRLIRRAAKLNDDGIKVPKQSKPRKPLPMPREFAAALAKSKPASKVFAAFSPSAQREYIEWISEAKRDDTRDKRIATAIEWIAEGKQRNWKYMK